jgi:outer membrane protein TolC
MAASQLASLLGPGAICSMIWCAMKKHPSLSLRRAELFAVALLACALTAAAQDTASKPAETQAIEAPAPQSAPSAAAGQAGSSVPQSNAPLMLTLQDALELAKKSNPDYRSAVTDYGLAKEDKVQGRAAVLPSVNFNTSYLYTQINNVNSSGTVTQVPRYIANNSEHEYVSQGNIHEDLSVANVAAFRRTQYLQAAARARAEIAARGLVVTVVQAYYGFVVAQRKYATAQRAFSEGQRFFGISQKLEQGGEVAHSDVIKAQIQQQQQQRDLQEAELETGRSRLELAVLVFPDFNQNFSVVDDLQMPEPLPPFAEIQAAGAKSNPELRAAIATLQAAKQDVAGSWNGFLPALSLDYFYGIDATHYATYTDGLRNLGYSAFATLQLPIWNWGANVSRLKQADLRRDQAKVELSYTQRALLAKLQTFYAEAETSRAELESLNQSAELAAESLRLTTLRYQAGDALVLEVVDAQTTLTLARNNFNDGQARFRVALANLQTLTGNF